MVSPKTATMLGPFQLAMSNRNENSMWQFASAAAVVAVIWVGEALCALRLLTRSSPCGRRAALLLARPRRAHRGPRRPDAHQPRGCQFVSRFSPCHSVRVFPISLPDSRRGNLSILGMFKAGDDGGYYYYQHVFSNTYFRETFHVSPVICICVYLIVFCSILFYLFFLLFPVSLYRFCVLFHNDRICKL